MPEVRLAVQEKHRGDPFGSGEGQRGRVERGGRDRADERGDGEPAQHETGVHTTPADHFALSRSMNCATAESARRSSTKRIADFGIRTKGYGL